MATHYTGLHVWVILGRNSTRKGSVIRSLTGLHGAKDCDVMLVSGQQLRIWAQMRSINEAEEEAPLEFVKNSVGEAGIDPTRDMTARRNILIALRLDFGKPGWEPEDYIRELIAQGAFIESIETLGEPTREWVKKLGVPFASVVDTSTATNGIAAEVRRHWGWH